MSSANNTPMSFRPSAELKQRIKAVAKKERRSSSQIILLAIEEGIQKLESASFATAAIQE